MANLRIFVSIDGAIHEPFPLRNFLFSAPPPNYSINGLAGNDSGISRSVEVHLDSFKVGSDWDVGDTFVDNFSSSGFSSWDFYTPGSPTVLDESGGQANLVFSDDLPGSPNIFKDVASIGGTTGEDYFTAHAKCLNPVHGSTAASVGHTLIDFGDLFWVYYYSDGIQVQHNIGSDTPVFYPLDMSIFRTIGVRFLYPDHYTPPSPPPDPSTLEGVHAVYHNGAWHVLPSMQVT